MNKVIFTGFNDEKKAYEGAEVLRDLHKEGSITVYADAVVTKDPTGKVAVRQPAVAGPIGTVAGLLTGGLVGLVGGPAGVAVGGVTGGTLGAGFDLAQWGTGQDFVDLVGERLSPGKSAVVADIDETWEIPLDTRMEPLGAIVMRYTKSQVEDALAEKDIEAQQAELANLEAEKIATMKTEQTKKSAERTAKLQEKIDAAKRKLQEKQDQLAARIKSVKKEGDDKVAMLQGQMTTANDEAKAQLQKRVADVRADYDARQKKLSDALAKRKAAQAA